jgi:arginine/lysine/ornithine decarboxylase
MDHAEAPVLDALADYHRREELPFTPPGHKQGRGADPRVRAVLGDDVFRSDVLATAGLDDRTSSNGVLQQAQELMADAVGAENAFFSTCGSSLSVKSAMLSVAGPHEKLLVGRDAHKSVIAGIILSGLRPIWVAPQWDPDLRLAHPPAAEEFARGFAEHPDARGALVTSPTPYGTCADLAAVTRFCHERGVPVIVDEAWGAHLPFHPELPTWAMDAGADVCVTSVHKMGGGLEQGSVFHQQGDLVDPDITRLGVVGYSAADWLREHHRLNLHLSDHRRISAQLTYADDEKAVRRLTAGLRDLVEHAERKDSGLRAAGEIAVPSPRELQLELVHLPRDAFFGRTTQVPIEHAEGRVAAEMITPYPPGIPVAVPGERLNHAVIDYLRCGVTAGMVVPDATDSGLTSVRVLDES